LRISLGQERRGINVVNVETLDDAIEIMNALNGMHRSARADRMQKGYLVRGGKKDEEKNFIGRPDTGSHGADQNRREPCTVAGGTGNDDVLLR
jgi:hypothetical protein